MHKDFATNNAVDGMNIFNCEFELKNATHVDSINQSEVWLDNLVQQ